MKYFLSIILSLFVLKGVAQSDTLYLDNPRHIANKIFGALDTSLYKSGLINRSLTEFPFTIEQMNGDYSQTHSALSWLQMYQDVELSYVDSNIIPSSREMIQEVINQLGVLDYENDELVLPFALLYHNLSSIDTSVFNQNNFTAINSELIPILNEETLYNVVSIKSATILEIYGDSGYPFGKIVLDKKFISTSSDISIGAISIDVGSGFEELSETHSIEFNRNRDSIVAYAAIELHQNNRIFFDTIAFYLTGIIDETAKAGDTKAALNWDHKYTKNFNPDTDLKLRVAINYGCGNNQKIRRPIIFLPPYRPSGQLISMHKYYKQFNIGGLFESLVELGYDVIFIKEKPGNRSISESGLELASFIWELNAEKKSNYPNEDWENIISGFSAGGQHVRYALMYMEKKHMEEGFPHHHTRLYIPFDSPNHGANIPMMTQAVFYEMDRTWNVNGSAAFGALIDDAAKDMAINHIIGGQISNTSGSNIYDIIHAPTSERVNLVNQLNNSFQHIYTPTDQRKSFPVFCRNVSIATGRYNMDYNTEYNFSPGLEVFTQNTAYLAWFGFVTRNRSMNASWYNSSATVFYRKDIRMILNIIPIITHRRYKSHFLEEYDQAQGGYKNEFYDKNPAWFIFPTSPVGILRQSALYAGQKHYKRNVSFLPITSALAINPSIWGNNNLFYNPQDEGLMYQTELDFINEDKSDFFGYPHLAYPATHFEITPFESVYIDEQTYEHIKIAKSVDPINEPFLYEIRNYFVNEVEATTVFLQNKIIGENHLDWDPNFVYKAWYKAQNEIVIGNNVTPKTDPGDYIIQSSGSITVHAGNSISLQPGFQTQNGSEFHAFIYWDGCSTQNRSENESESGSIKNNHLSLNSTESKEALPLIKETNSIKLKIYPNPNNGSFRVILTDIMQKGTLKIHNSLGVVVYEKPFDGQELQVNQIFESGIYFVTWTNSNDTISRKMIVL